MWLQYTRSYKLLRTNPLNANKPARGRIKIPTYKHWNICTSCNLFKTFQKSMNLIPKKNIASLLKRKRYKIAKARGNKSKVPATV